MRVVVVGATGNVGTSLLERLADESGVNTVIGVARRVPAVEYPKTDWAQADVTSDDLRPMFAGADAVVHLAWAIQPSHDQRALWRTNVEGSKRVFQAAAAARVPTLVYASSVGAYSAGPKTRRVGESWPVDGIGTSFYGRHKAKVESLLDDFEREQPSARVVRMRPALIFKRGAASGIRRLFLGPLLPSPLLRRTLVPLVPSHPELRFQAVHSLDVGQAYRLALTSDVRGAFNLAAEPVLDGPKLAKLVGAVAVPVPKSLLRGGAALTWRLHLQPSPPGWVDLGFGVPLLDWARARDELGWSPTRSATEALRELVAGLRDRAGLETPPLSPDAGGPMRTAELASGVGKRE